MKKNTRIISVAAAALLAVAPVVSSTMTANAAMTIGPSTTTGTGTGTSSTTMPTTRPYFTYDGKAVDEAVSGKETANVIPTTINIKVGENASDIAKAISDLNIMFYGENSSKGEKVSPSETDVITALKSSGVDFGKNGTHIKSIKNSMFNLTISNTGTGNNAGKTATIQIPFVQTDASTSTPTDTDSPVIKYTLNGQTADLNGAIFQVPVNSNFNPTDFVNSNGEQVTVRGQQTSQNNTIAVISATSNPVNTSEAGRYYNVTITATNFNGKTTSATYTVLITSSHQQTLYGNGASTISTYSIYGNNVLSGSTTFKDGDKVYVADQTRTIDKVSYSQVSPKSKNDASNSNVWVKTSSLVKPAVTETSETHTVMVASRAYDKNGNYLGHDYGLYTSIDIVPTVVTINGKTYYKVAGKDEYVRVTNITGTKRRLTRNAYIYWSSYRRTPGTGKYYRGQTVTTYGASIRFKNGKKYYRIEGCRNNNKRYIKAVNFY